MTTTNLTAVNGTITNLNSININTVNLNGQNATLVNLTSGNITAANLTLVNTLSVKPGASVDMGGNRVQNVAPGIVASDAANYGQLQAVDKRAREYAAIAAAATAMPLSPTGVGETTVSAGVGAAGGRPAIAIGLASRINESLTIKANAGAANGASSVGIGIGYTFK
ncbi:MAG TPA: YadA-like family protein [Burkholderiaceae bacterium]|nr:YadA-like family protein [Burkholderiaceae bacterium]